MEMPSKSAVARSMNALRYVVGDIVIFSGFHVIHTQMDLIAEMQSRKILHLFGSEGDDDVEYPERVAFILSNSEDGTSLAESMWGRVSPGGILCVRGTSHSLGLFQGRLHAPKWIDDGAFSFYRKPEDVRWANPYTTIGPLHVSKESHFVVGAVIAQRVLSRLPYGYAKLRRMTLMDIGCGTGRGTFSLSPFFKKSVGWDPSDACIQEARRVMGELGARTRTSFPNRVKVCDIGISWNVLQHLHEPDEEMSLLESLAKQRKHVVFSCRKSQVPELATGEGICVVSCDVQDLRSVLRARQR